MILKIHSKLKYVILLVVSALYLNSCAEMPFFQKMGSDPKQQLSEYSEPSVVRVVTGCFGQYTKFPVEEAPENQKKLWIQSDYPRSDSPIENGKSGFFLGTGYFINPNGYLVTSTIQGKFAEDFPTKNDCKKHLVNIILNEFKVSSGDKKERDLTNEEKKKAVESILSNDRADIPSGITISMKDDDLNYYKHVLLGKGDKYDFEFVKGSVKSGKDVALIKIEIKDAPALHLNDTEKPKVQNGVWILGYPPEADFIDPEKLQKSQKQTLLEFVKGLLSETKKLQVTFVQRTISSAPIEFGNYATVIQLDGQVKYGMSGSPVLNANGEVIGTVTNTSFGSSQTYAVPASAIKEILNLTSIQNDPGNTYNNYKSGLEDFSRKEYRRAEEKFRDVKTAFPKHSRVEDRLQETQSAILKSSDNKSWLWLILAFLGLSLPAIVYFLMRQNQRLSNVSASRNQIPNRYSEEFTSQIPSSSRERESTTIAVSQFIELNSQNQKSLRFYLGKDEHRLGRDSEWSDFEISGKEWKLLSSRHAILRKESDDYRLYDGDGINKTTNGNFINGTRITPEKGYLLRHGMQIKIGADSNFILLTYYNPTNSTRRNDPTEYAE